jgi:hypothetical protein
MIKMRKFNVISCLTAAAAALLLLGIVPGLSSPAAAGEEAELSCPLAALGEADRAAIASLDMDRAKRGMALQAASRGVAQCAIRFEWNDVERMAASHYIPAFLARARYRQVLAGEGLDLARIEREILGNAALMAAAVAMRRDPPELIEELRRIAAAEQAWVTRNEKAPEKMEAFGGFVAATVLAEAARIRFTHG